MIVATSQNITSGVVQQDGSPGNDINDTIDYTFDTLWAGGTSFNSTIVRFTTGNNYEYIGIAGHNLGSLGVSITIENHDVVDVLNYMPIDDRPIMFEVEPRSGGSIDLRITMTKQSSSDRIILSHVAAGFITDFTSTTDKGQVFIRDYQAGYSRNNMSLGRKSKAILNESAAPVATLIKTVSQKSKLNINNVPTDFAKTDLLGYQNFWVNNAFFIQYDDDITQSTMAMQFIPIPPKSHPNTRNLVNLSYSFLEYNGL